LLSGSLVDVLAAEWKDTMTLNTAVFNMTFTGFILAWQWCCLCILPSQGSDAILFFIHLFIVFFSDELK